jgi:hypothetical protein
MKESSAETEKVIRFGTLWKEIPTVAKFIAFGLTLIAGFVVGDFIRMVTEPGPLVPGEDLYIHIAMVILVPGSMLGMYAVSFGYAYYQLCKRWKREPFWKRMMD